MAVSDKELVGLGPWPKGQDDATAETALPKDALRRALNVDLDKQGYPSLRKGFTSRYSGTAIHSLGGDPRITLFVESGALKRLMPDYSALTLRSGLDVDRPMSYEFLNGETYYSNGVQTGKITAAGVAQAWGVPTPSGQPTVTDGTDYGDSLRGGDDLAVQAASGTTGLIESGTGSMTPANGPKQGVDMPEVAFTEVLEPGAAPTLTAVDNRYLVAVTFLSASGEESGAKTPVAVFGIAPTGDIQLTNIPQGDAAKIAVYFSHADSEQLYRVAVLDMGTTSASIPASAQRGKILDTLFMEQAPAGQIVRYYNGRVYIAEDNVLWYTEALRYGLYSPAKNFFMFSERITMVEPVQGGIYVSADQTYHLNGKDAPDMQQTPVSPYKAIEGTSVQLQGSLLGLEEQVLGKVAYWYGERGGVVGLPGGLTKHLTEDRVAQQSFERGATLFREEEGIRSLLSALQTPGDDGAFGATDVVTSRIIRNGVVVQ